jgi:uncharacterized phage-associated protein
MRHDVRSVANFVLDLAEVEGRVLSNLSINKIVFFLHAYYLVEFKKPLVSAKIEAWNYGPVFRELYREFKGFGDQAIIGRAYRLNPTTGEREKCEYEFSGEEQQFLEALARRYIRFSPGTLVALSHQEGGPWDQVWNHRTVSRPSMHISDDIIRSWHNEAARH